MLSKYLFSLAIVSALASPTPGWASVGVKATAEGELKVPPSNPLPDGSRNKEFGLEIKAEKPKPLIEILPKELMVSGQSYTPRGQAQVLGTERYRLDAAGSATMISVGMFYWPWKASERVNFGISPGISYSRNKYPLQTSSGFTFPEIRLNTILFSLRGAMDYHLNRTFSLGFLLGPAFLTSSHSATVNNTANWSSRLWIGSGGLLLKAKLLGDLRLATAYERRFPLERTTDLDVQSDNLQVALLYAF